MITARMRLSTKLISLFLLLGIVPSLVVGGYSYLVASNSLREEAFNRLSLIREGKRDEIGRYLNSVYDRVATFAEDPTIIAATTELSEAFALTESELSRSYLDKQTQHDELLKARYEYQRQHTTGISQDTILQWWPRSLTARILQYHYIAANPSPIDKKSRLDAPPEVVSSHRYSRVHARYHPFLRNFTEKRGYDDLFLIDLEGQVVYSVSKELDFATNLINGPFSSTSLAKVVTAALSAVSKDAVFTADFEPYAPSYNAPAAFVAMPIFRENQKVGAIAMQVPVKGINDIMTSHGQWKEVGMGETGESYLIGPDNKFRSLSRFFIQDPELFQKTLKEAGVAEVIRERIKTFRSTVGILEFKSSHIAESHHGDTHSGEVTLDYRKKPVLITHTPVKNRGFDWVVVASIEEEEAFHELNQLRWVMGAIVLIEIITVMAVGWFFARSISRPLQGVISVLSGSSSEIAATVTQHERISALQASSVNETNTTMEELASSSRQSAEQAETAAANSQKAMEAAEHGMSRVEEMLQGMNTTKNKVDAIAQQILHLSELTGQIGAITGTVTDFANETKMLAMNAAVEAVRAGEHGKGFSVLSVEIRKLAEESKRSAERINALVGEIQRATNSTVMVTEEGNKTVEQGILIAQNTAEAFAEVAESINNASQSSQQISLNVRQQSVAIKQVVEAMKTINSGAKETSSGIGQVKSGVQTLNESAIKLKGMI